MIAEYSVTLENKTKSELILFIEKLQNMLKEKDKEIEYYKKQKDYDMQFRHELLEHIRCLNLNKDEKDEEIEKLKKHNKELLRKLRNRVKEVRKLNKYSLYKKEFKRLNEQIKKKDEIIKKLEKEAQKYFEEIIKQARIIDLMAEQLRGVPINKNIPNFEKPNLKECITIFTNKEDIKQYFERKAEKE